ncbi:hypothetical protein ACFPM7_00330 [Actinokineospora guangxiensis]|uniref:MFS transporter n=1 Tax=Actinokineospora guangxiensis TaxID=1490288 RepID=A0ABW0EEV1_9PSEU
MTSRRSRGALLGACTGALAIAAHGAAGGGFPDAAPTVAIVALVAWAGSALAGTGPWVAFALLAGGQSALHLLLTGVAHPDTPAGDAPVNGLLMTAAHVLATALAAWLHARAGHALDLIGAALRGLVRALVAPPSSPPAAVAPPAGPRVGTLLAVVLRVVCARRGPPIPS